MLLTDGITESTDFNDEVFGVEGALNVIRTRQQSTAGELAEALCTAARNFVVGGPQIDDIMAVVCKVVDGRSAPPAQDG